MPYQDFNIGASGMTIEAYTANLARTPYRSVLCVSAASDFYRQNAAGTFDVVSGPDLMATHMLNTTERTGKLYIADYQQPPISETNAGIATDGTTVALDPGNATLQAMASIDTTQHRVYLTNVSSGLTEGVYAISAKTDTGPVKSVTSSTRSGTTQTVNLSAHGYAAGDVVIVGGANEANFNGRKEVLTVATNSFTVGCADSGATTATGTLTAQKCGTLELATTAGAGGGTATVYVLRRPKVYDAIADTLDYWDATAGKGTLPINCPLICTYRDRIVVAGASHAPQVWYMSRQGDPNDWDYSQEDAQTAVAATNTLAGRTGQPITALIPWKDDFLLFGCINSLWVLRGDPALDGSIDQITTATGILPGGRAWCKSPRGELIFLGDKGMWVLQPTVSTVPELLSKAIPIELQRLDENLRAVLVYDTDNDGVWVFLTEWDGTTVTTGWWFDWEAKAWWPLTLPADLHVTTAYDYPASIASECVILLGSQDGYIRKMSSSAATDDGTTISSYCELGPFSGTGAEETTIDQLLGTTDTGSANVTWQVRAEKTAEAAISGTAKATGTFVAGLNHSARPMRRGNAILIRLQATGQWAMERLQAILQNVGRRKA